MTTDFLPTGVAASQENVQCSGNSNNSDKESTTATLAGSSTATRIIDFDNSAADLNAFWIEIPAGAAGYDGASGNWNVPLGISVGNHQITWDEVHICHVDSSYIAKNTLGGNVGIGKNLSSQPAAETVNQASGVTIAAGDLIIIIFAFDNAQSMSNQITVDLDFASFGITAPGGVPAGEIRQSHFRIRNIGALQTINQNSDWAAAIDTDATLDALAKYAGCLFGLRFELEEVATVSASKTVIPKIQHRVNAGTWTDLNDATVDGSADNYITPGNSDIDSISNVIVVNKATITDGAATTNILSGSSKTFVAGTGEHDTIGASVTLNDQHTEIEWRILIRNRYNTKQESVDTDEYEFRIVESDNTLLDGTYVIPKITLNLPAGYIGGTGIETSGNRSYIALPDGTLYAPIEDGEQGANIVMLKSIDDGVKWLQQDASVAIGADLESFSMVYDDVNKIIHCLKVNSGALYYQYATKDHATETPDTWLNIGGGSVYEHVLEASIDSINQSADIVIRGTTIYAFYADLATTDQVFYIKKTDLSKTDNWGSRVTIDATGGSTDFSGVAAALGPNSNLIHIFYTDYSQFNVHHISLSGADALGTPHTCDSDLTQDAGERQHGMTNAICWYNGSVEKAMIGYKTETEADLFTCIVEEDGTPDTPLNASNSVDVLSNPTGVNSRQVVATLAHDPFDDAIYLFYAEDATEDLWRATSADGAAWTGHTEEVSDSNWHALRAQIHTEAGGDTVVGYIYDQPYNQDAASQRSGFSGSNGYATFFIRTGGADVTFAGSALLATTTPGTGVLAVARAFSGASLLAHVTPDTPVLAVDRSFAGASLLATTTPDTVTLAISKFFAGVAALLTTTPDTGALAVDRSFAGAALLATTTPSIVLAVDRSFGGAALLATTTPDTVLLLKDIPFAGTSLLATVTPDTVAMQIAKFFSGTAALITTTPSIALIADIGFTGAALLATATPSALIAVDRAFVGTSILQTTTPDTPMLNISIPFTGTSALITTTPDNVVIALSKLFAGSALLATTTPPIAMAVDRAFGGQALLATTTPSIAMIADLAFGGVALLATVTPDDVVLEVGGIVTFAGQSLLATVTPSVALIADLAFGGSAALITTTPSTVLAVDRSFSGTTLLATSTPDTVMLAKSIPFTGSALLATTTPSVELSLVKLFAGSALMATNTPDVSVLAVDRSFGGQALLLTVTPDTVELTIAGTISFAGTSAFVTTTPAGVLAVARAFAGQSAMVTTTPSGLLSVGRSFGGQSQLVTTTPSIALAVDRSFGGTAHVQFTTTDLAILGLVLQFAGQAHLQTTTPDDVEIFLRVAAGLIRLIVTARRPGTTVVARRPGVDVTGRT